MRAELAYETHRYVSNLVAATQLAEPEKLGDCIRAVESLKQHLDRQWPRPLPSPPRDPDHLRVEITRGEAGYDLIVETDEGTSRNVGVAEEELRELLAGRAAKYAAINGGVSADGREYMFGLREGHVGVTVFIPAEEFRPELRRAMTEAGLQWGP